jgi:hypothetical protein
MIGQRPRPTLSQGELEAWCLRWLGSSPHEVLFETGHLSAVCGVRLADGREVVIKARPESARIASCVAVQRQVWTAGFPCPEPLAGPAAAGTLTATAETLVAGGTELQPCAEMPQLFAASLAELVALTSPLSGAGLAPPPAWVWWGNDRQGLWPPPDDRDADLNMHQEPAWVDTAARRIRRRLNGVRQPGVVGHLDWYSENLQWEGRTLRAVHDWDSLAIHPEAAIAGVAAAIFPTSAGGRLGATVNESVSFLEQYAETRGRRWRPEELEIAWAAGVWTRLFDVKKEAVDIANGPLMVALAGELDERLTRAGA